MGNIDIKPVRKKAKIGNSTRTVSLYEEADLRKFNPLTLGLGHIGVNSRTIDSIAVVFDLTGFTEFCSREDSHLKMPVFLKGFLKWLFERITSSIVMQRIPEGVRTYTYLPFFAKFMGDGVLFLWDTEDMNDTRICNVVIQMDGISAEYEHSFLPQIKERVTSVPKSLKCAVARGHVCSVGSREDYVGQCINLASRLQKESGLRFCCWKIGIDMEKGMRKAAREWYTSKILEIRGISREELVIIGKEDFEGALEEVKERFRDVEVR
jgi:class 3 adenylate cyclase